MASNKLLHATRETRAREQWRWAAQMKHWILTLTLVASNAIGAESVVTVTLDPLPDSAVEAHLAKIGSPERVMLRAEASKFGLAHIRLVGPISESEIPRLLQLSEPELIRSVGQIDSRWTAEIVGDSRFAVVRYAYVCGSLCGLGVDLVFGRDTNGWRFLYKARQWIS